MTLYKFKPLTDFEYVADIIIHKRLYSTEFTNLNDPMEGVFEHSDGTKQSIIDMIIKAKEKHKVCALAKEYSNPILWAHYADSFKGVCIEVEVDENLIHLHDIKYHSITPIIDFGRAEKFSNETINVDELSVAALTRKYEDWAYEKEMRILNTTDNKYISNGITVKSVLFGANTSNIYKNVISKIISPSIILYDTSFDDNSKVHRCQYTA